MRVTTARGAALGSFVTALALAPPTRAVTLGGEVDHFRLELAPQGATVCVALPASETRPRDCAGVDVEQLRRGVAGSSVTEVFVVRRAGDDYLVHYSVERGKEPRGVLASYTGELTKLLGSKVSVKESLTHVHLGEVEVFGRSFSVSRPAALGEANEIQYFLIPGRTAVHAVSVVAPASVAPRARADLFAAFDGATVEISFMAKLWRTATRFAVVGVVGVGVLVGAVALLIQRFRRKTR